jgi:hypothetical protein
VHLGEMKKLTLTFFIVSLILVPQLYLQAQVEPVSKWIFRIGPKISFATKAIANNDAGVGIIGAAEKNIHKNLSVGAETGFTYFLGDKSYFMYGKNKAYTIPLMVEIKRYFLSQYYISPRIGGIYFLLNNLSKTHIQFAYGFASGINLPKESNRINIQAGYTSFRYDHLQRGYATLAAAIIIN